MNIGKMVNDVLVIAGFVMGIYLAYEFVSVFPDPKTWLSFLK